jgi:hypothetical protein
MWMPAFFGKACTISRASGPERNAKTLRSKQVMKCDRCLSSTKPPAPMLQDATWQKLAKRHETLCAKCLFGRASKMQIHLAFDDLLPCAFNLAGAWFDMFLAADSPDQPVLPERAYAWQHAMIIYSKQMDAGLPAQDLPRAGKELATDHDGLTLREAPEGGVYRSDEINPAAGEKYLKVHRSDGSLEAEIFIRFEGDNVAQLREIIGPRGPNSLGTGGLRSVCRLLQQAYPKIETLSGIRVTGAHRKNPKKLKISVRRIANAIRQAA